MLLDTSKRLKKAKSDVSSVSYRCELFVVLLILIEVHQIQAEMDQIREEIDQLEGNNSVLTQTNTSTQQNIENLLQERQKVARRCFTFIYQPSNFVNLYDTNKSQRNTLELILLRPKTNLNHDIHNLKKRRLK